MAPCTILPKGQSACALALQRQGCHQALIFFPCCAFKSCRNAKSLEEGWGLPTGLLGKGSWEFLPETKLRFQHGEVGGGLCWVRPVIGLQSPLGRTKTEVKREEPRKGRKPSPPSPPPQCASTQACKRVQPLAWTGSVCAKGDGNRWTQGALYPKSTCKASRDGLANSWT